MEIPPFSSFLSSHKDSGIFFLSKKNVMLLLLIFQMGYFGLNFKCEHGTPNKLFFKKTKSLPLGIFYNLLCFPTRGFCKPVSLAMSLEQKNFQLFLCADCVLIFLVLIRNIHMFYVLDICVYIYIYKKSLAVPKVNSLRMYSIIYCSVTDRVKKI